MYAAYPGGFVAAWHTYSVVAGLEKLVEPVPRDVWDALARELVSFIPVIGDIFDLVEAFEAFRAGETMLGLLYLVQVLPGPPLPLTHIIAYELGRRGGVLK